MGTITDMNVQIASACEEQTIVAKNINQNQIHINDVTQHADKTAENIAVSSQSLATVAEDLEVLLGKFKV